MAGTNLGLSRSSDSLHCRDRRGQIRPTRSTADSDSTLMGQRLFTGPGGVRDYRAHVVTDNMMVGIGTMSPEGTSELRYICRGATGTPPPKPRSKWVGEIGWFMPFTDVQNMRTGHQINLATFRHAQENKYTHRFQEPWYPSPNHPNYSKGFPFTKGRPTSTLFQNSSQPSYAQSKHEKRPHTVASFHSTDGGASPNVNNSAQNIDSYHSDHTGSSRSLHRPASGSHVSAMSVHSGDDSYFKPRSLRSSSAPNSRPMSGGFERTSTGTPYNNVHPPSLHLSHSSLGRCPLSGSSFQSIPGDSISHSSYNGSSALASPLSIKSSRSTQRSNSRSRGGSRQSSGHSSVSVSRRGLVPAATSIYRPPQQPKY